MLGLPDGYAKIIARSPMVPLQGAVIAVSELLELKSNYVASLEVKFCCFI